MGEVWEAQHLHLKRPAAIKFMNRHLLTLNQAEDYQRFLEEARILASLKSPHTIQVLDFGHCDDGRYYLATEYLVGMDCEHLVRRFGALPAGRVALLLRQACESLAEAHALGLIHRDIKPANLYLSHRILKGDWLTVLDFGLARSVHTPAREEKLLGTPEFMSPEQFLESPLDGRSDIYSLGCVAYFLLTGRVPFPRQQVEEMVQAHLSETPEPLSLHTPSAVPPELAQVVMNCLHKDPSRRPGSARELAHRLAACMPPRSWTARDSRLWWTLRAPKSGSKYL